MIKLLIVDEDDEQRSKIIKSICWNRIGVYICGEASTGREGLKEIRLLHPDIVLTNIQLSEIDGLEMIKRGRKEVDFRAIVIANYKSFDYLKSAMAIGIESQSFFVKPIRKKELEVEITRISALIVSTYKWKRKRAKDNELVEYALDYIKSNYNKQIGLSDISEVKNISTDYYRRIIKEYMGQPFISILNEYRVEIALKLKKQGYPMKTIAKNVGFENYNRLVYNIKKYVEKCDIQCEN